MAAGQKSLKEFCMCLFVAIPLSEDMKKTVTGTMHDLKQKGVRGNYVPARNLHLTLAFLGETDSPGAVKEALSALSFRPFRLSFSDMGTFGDLLWVGVKGNQGLSAAAKAVREALDQAGIGYDRKKFSPHVTIVRRAAGNWKQVPAPKGDMTVTHLSLMKTTFQDGKPVYSEVCRIGS